MGKRLKDKGMAGIPFIFPKASCKYLSSEPHLLYRYTSKYQTQRGSDQLYTRYSSLSSWSSPASSRRREKIPHTTTGLRCWRVDHHQVPDCSCKRSQSDSGSNTQSKWSLSSFNRLLWRLFTNLLTITITESDCAHRSKFHLLSPKTCGRFCKWNN